MEAIFYFVPKDSPSSKILAEDLTQQEDFQKFLRGSIDKSVTVSLKLTEKTPEKQRMYDYYHKVILAVAIQVYTNDGWESVDKVKADYLLKAECGKGIMYNSKTNQEEIFLEDKSSMNKGRLRKFLSDCITFLEVEKGATVPDSDSYLHGEGFRNVKSIKK